jgi:tRNA 2-thiocytidine biosynthesis protein TtcA
MLAEWERDFPGRTESIFSAIRNVETAHLADPEHFDFAGLDALRAAFSPVARMEPISSDA